MLVEDEYSLLIAVSVILLFSFFFGEVSKRTSIPSVLMLIVLGIVINLGIESFIQPAKPYDWAPILKTIGVVGLIMIVLEAALELELKPEKYIPIAKAFGIALIGLVLSTWVAALALEKFIPEMDMARAWVYATPISILSSAIIIPSVTDLRPFKKEFHIYESTFSDILGIILFYFLTGQFEGDAAHGGGHSTGALSYIGTIVLTVLISLVASYLIVLIFQNIKSHVKLFLLIAVLLLLYAVGKKMHLSSLIIILVFGLLIANMRLFFVGPLKKMLQYKKALHIYEGLHVITMETAFVVRTFFFVIFGITIDLASLASLEVAVISLFIIASIYIIRYVILRLFLGKDIFPQLFVAPRGLITILLFIAIPEAAQTESFEGGILLFVIIGTSLIMTIAMIVNKNRTNVAIKKAENNTVGSHQWTAPTIEVEP